ncbi:MAG: ribonuclease J, partial [Eggerthellaceae bacterium]|nr:ribonuclease J [Eggerthellaceae bacterium]
YDKSRALVHVSGHAGAEELKMMLCMAQPRAFVPVHGEAAHLRAHAELAAATGVPRENIFILENGDTLELTTKGIAKGEPVQAGVVYVDGLSVGDTSQAVLNDRSSLSAQGFAAISAAFSRKTSMVKGDVQVEMRGITGGDDAWLIHECETVLAGALQRGLTKEYDDAALKKVMRDSLLSFLWDRIQQRPMVVVHLLEV